ncbi:class I SAM-dependent methyltransferase [Synechococcus sp. CCY9201]|uniref:class I SAM-dependent methyltransferase n=1 Tax=Synechococcus sp. CCY9201 TaxID=174697 RepID=UPI002B209E5F|nr:class I SAM-dependent methyltransferase [Synechococcus sp. CCY9201]MEA5474110.1 class I SAM-dependent methyltransferase [Synechococcus sp. CCY9201]
MSPELRLPSLIAAMADNPDLWEMGHGQRQEVKDLGLGWTYYGLTRTLRPSFSIVIGSWRGFVPLLIGQAIQDNGNSGSLLFIDPSFVDNQWKDGRAKDYFSSYGITCIEHRQQTSQEVIAEPEFSRMAIDLLFIDGLHTEEQCRLEFESFLPRLTPGAIALFHDSHSQVISEIYGKEKSYAHTTWRYIEELRGRRDLQVFDLPIAQGVTLVQRTPQTIPSTVL